ncbi:hypothetical protein GQ54DRAFT_303212 [Martensiomyces pterosporus]|nr:hypothetical protein GQ54DRAFT_303212 [Martensiomyces pterosporus]
MVKCTFALGLLAASLASASIVSVAKDPQADVKVFTPSLPSEAKFNVYNDPVSVAAGAQPASFVGAASKDNGIKDKVSIAVAYLNKNHNIPTENIKVTDAYTSQQTGVTHVHVRQVVAGVEVANGIGNININRQGKVISSSNTFASSESVKKVKRSAESLVTRADDSASVKAALKSLTDYVKTSVDSAAIDKLPCAYPVDVLPSCCDLSGCDRVCSTPKSSLSKGTRGKVSAKPRRARLGTGAGASFPANPGACLPK